MAAPKHCYDPKELEGLATETFRTRKLAERSSKTTAKFYWGLNMLQAIFRMKLGCSLPSDYLTFRHRASSIQDRLFATLQRTLFIYLINKYISLSDIYLTVHH